MGIIFKTFQQSQGRAQKVTCDAISFILTMSGMYYDIAIMHL